MSLPKARIRELRSEAHNLKPAVKLGKAGLTDGVVATVEERLCREGLVKVSTADEAADAVAAGLAERLQAEIVQVVGKTCTLWRLQVSQDGTNRRGVRPD